MPRGRRHRPLRVELMENRLMLSTTTFELAPVESQVPSNTPSSWQSPDRIRFLMPGWGGEGGFITDSAGSIRLHLSGQFASASDIVTVSLADLNYDGQAFTVQANGVLHLNREIYHAAGIRPLVFFPDNMPEHASPNERFVAARNEVSTPSQEGGSISLQTVLTGMQTGERLAASQTTSLLVTAAKPIEASDSGVSSELARAIVFEIAGGERDGYKPTDDTQQTRQLKENTRQFDTDGQQANQPNGEKVPPVDRFGLFDPQVMPTQGQLASTPQPDSDASETAETASALAFEQFGEGTAAIIESSERQRWNRAIGTMPLLMMLALERIAAHSSRRSKRILGTVFVQKPKPLAPTTNLL
jgi:hypothetical protein